MNLSVIGLGKLGACAAACFAYRGFRTVGVDINLDFVRAINCGRAPVIEPRLQEIITAAASRLTATSDCREAIDSSDVSFLIVPTPSTESGEFSDRFLRLALERLASALRDKRKPYHLFVITSTVSPGTTETSLVPLIESASGRRVNRDFGICYNPEFIALGNVINDSLNPDLILIGEGDHKAGDMLEDINRRVCENQPFVARMPIVSAEIAKISLNSFVTMKISYANTLAQICERIEGADVDAITSALGADRRISPYYLRGGLSFGGPCFPRDNRAFAAFARRYGCCAPLAEATDVVNQQHIESTTRRIMQYVDGKRDVAVLGLSYKPNTSVIEESPAKRMVERLIERGMTVTVYDPLAMDNARAVFGDSVRYASSVADCVAEARVVLVPTPWPEFKEIEQLAHNPMVLVDCWRFLDSQALKQKGVKYVTLGRASG
jgi:UDPglucose 6-dehydrogenase